MTDKTEDDKETDDPIHKQSWFRTKWRPAMAWQYLVVCVFDFLVAPLASAWYAWAAKIPYQAWKPITMSEGGFYHMAMGAIVGISAFMRGQERIADLGRYRRSSSSYYDDRDSHLNDFDTETERRIAEARRRSLR